MAEVQQQMEQQNATPIQEAPGGFGLSIPQIGFNAAPQLQQMAGQQQFEMSQFNMAPMTIGIPGGFQFTAAAVGMEGPTSPISPKHEVRTRAAAFSPGKKQVNNGFCACLTWSK